MLQGRSRRLGGDIPEPGLVISVDFPKRLYEYTASLQEINLKHAYRQLYQPKPERLPEWLRRVWMWC